MVLKEQQPSRLKLYQDYTATEIQYSNIYLLHEMNLNLNAHNQDHNLIQANLHFFIKISAKYPHNQPTYALAHHTPNP